MISLCIHETLAWICSAESAECPVHFPSTLPVMNSAQGTCLHVYDSTHPCIPVHPSTHPSIHLSIHPSITSSYFIYLFFHASISVDPYMDFVGQSLCLCIYPLSRGFLLHGACVHVQIQLIHLPLHAQDSNHCDLSLHIWISTYSHTGCRKIDMYTYVYLCTYVYIYNNNNNNNNNNNIYIYMHVFRSKLLLCHVSIYMLGHPMYMLGKL